MSFLIPVVFPAPWWEPLIYESASPCAAGARVRVPLGKTERIGIAGPAEWVERYPLPEGSKLRQIAGVLDNAFAPGWELWQLAEWLSRAFFCGMGTALSILLPSAFFEGAPCEELPTVLPPFEEEMRLSFLYLKKDRERWDQLRDILEKTLGQGRIVLFPERERAKVFWEGLSEVVREKGCLWPASGGKKLWQSWLQARRGEIDLVVGSLGAAFAPLPHANIFIIDDESSPAFRTQRHPSFHIRSLMSQRARLKKGQFVLSGRIPSARAYQKGARAQEGESKGIPRERLIFVDAWLSWKSQPKALREGLALSLPLRRLTQAALDEGRNAIWILDRKGYAGEVLCEECGKPLSCPFCGAIVRWQKKRRSSSLLCPSCFHSFPLPDRCPSCNGALLEGIRPGLDALMEAARRFFGRYSIKTWTAEESLNRKTMAEWRQALSEGVLVIGSRKALALCDEFPVRVIGWIDADGEATKPNYDARFSAFSMIWESAWRGLEPEERKIVVQSKRAAKGWQRSLFMGWSHFWEEELRERHSLDLPPFCPLITLSAPLSLKPQLLKKMENIPGIAVWDPRPPEGELVIRTRRWSALRELVAPYFTLRLQKREYPSFSIWTD